MTETRSTLRAWLDWQRTPILAAAFAGSVLLAGAGLVFGSGQQLRGAHFLSHDLWSLAVCWFLALGLFCLFAVPPGAVAPDGACA